MNGLPGSVRVSLLAFLTQIFGSAIASPIGVYRPEIYIELQPEDVVVSTERDGTRIWVTWSAYCRPPEKSAMVTMDPKQIEAGAGLILERSGMRKPAMELWERQDLREVDLADKTQFAAAKRVFQTRLTSRDLSEPGIYYISYEHPWENKQDVAFHSDIAVVAAVKPERLAQLKDRLNNNRDLAFASYRFRHPQNARACPEWRYYRYEALREIEKMEVIRPGVGADEVLFMLGSPDSVHKGRGYQSEPYDERWEYILSPVGGFYVEFVDGKVSAAYLGGDSG